MYTKIFISSFLVVLTTCVWGQQLSLSDYRKKVLEADEYLRISDEGRKIAKENRKSAKTALLPQLDFQGNYNFVKYLDFRQLNPHNYGANLVLSQNIYSGGGVEGQYKVSKLQENQAEQGYELTKDQLEQQLEKVYWSTSAYAEFYRATQQLLSITNKLYTQVQNRFDDGAAGKTDLLMLSTRIKETEAAVIQSNQNYIQSQQLLAMLMGESPESYNYTLESVLTPDTLVALASVDSVIMNRPDYQQALLDVEIQKEYKKINMSKVNPKIAIGAMGGYNTLSTNNDGKPYLNGALFANVSVPIFHWNDRGAIRSASKAAILSKELAAQRAADNIGLELSNALTAITESERLIQTATENVKIAEESLELVTFSYNEGQVAIVDVLSTQVAWIQSQNTLISAHLNLKMAIADYKKAISGF